RRVLGLRPRRSAAPFFPSIRQPVFCSTWRLWSRSRSARALTSCAFLTPIGHQSNTLILGPGGFRFGGYWRMGLLLEIIVAAVSVPMLLFIWPF
ncbi:MAG: hypothetical protein JXQ81_02295, partial [Desulfuromonadales bacterium]|nr:hypothetical protein [Desulfuromonadales bacterium]